MRMKKAGELPAFFVSCVCFGVGGDLMIYLRSASLMRRMPSVIISSLVA